MRIRNCLLSMSALLAVGLAQAGGEAQSARAQAAAILTGHVSSTEKGPMEGVVVSAKKDGATFTVSTDGGDVILTDGQGNKSKVVKTDIVASNGVIHVIDAVLLPPTK